MNYVNLRNKIIEYLSSKGVQLGLYFELADGIVEIVKEEAAAEETPE